MKVIVNYKKKTQMLMLRPRHVGTTWRTLPGPYKVLKPHAVQFNPKRLCIS